MFTFPNMTPMAPWRCTLSGQAKHLVMQICDGGLAVMSYLEQVDDHEALLPIAAQRLAVGRDEVAQVQVSADVQALHGSLQIL